MTREEYIKNLIVSGGYTIKSFANKIGMPYSTLLSMLKGSIGGAAVDNVIRVCSGLGITINDMCNACKESNSDIENVSYKLELSIHEKHIIYAYRNNPSMQQAVDKLLGIDADSSDQDMTTDDNIFDALKDLDIKSKKSKAIYKK